MDHLFWRTMHFCDVNLRQEDLFLLYGSKVSASPQSFQRLAGEACFNLAVTQGPAVQLPPPHIPAEAAPG